MYLIISILWKALYIALGAGAAWELAGHFGPAEGLGIWAGVMAIGCGIGALLLKTAPVGRVNWHNRVGSIFLPWGFQLSGGKLLPLTAIAWVVWVMVGVATVALQGSTTAENPGKAVLLFAIWMLYGGLCLRQLGLIFHHFRNSPRPRRSMIVLTAIMLGLVIISLVLWQRGWAWHALAVAGGPLVAIGGGYGLVLVSMLAFRGKGRWN